MGWLTTLASLVGLEVEELVARLRRNAVAWSMVGGLCVIALVFLLIALHAGLTKVLGPIWAPAAIAGGALLIALFIYGALRLTDAAAARREAERRKAAERTALATSAILTALPMAMRLGVVRKLGLPLGGALAAYLIFRSGRSEEPEDDADDVRS
jgi:hypothetical protein